jgi:thioredoxin-dependent peroxiredoxin
VSRALWTVALSLAVALPALAAIERGAKAPSFTAKASIAGKEVPFSLDDALAKGPVVVYFYPSAYTGGCNVEAHTFAEKSAEFQAAGATVIGVSHDSIARLNDYSADPAYCAGKFAVASDPDGSIAKSYQLQVVPGKPGIKDSRGAEIDHAFTERTTFVVAQDHTIVAVLSSAADKIAPAEHVTKSLAVVQSLSAVPAK